MARRYREQQTEHSAIIHCEGADGYDATLCGYVLEGEASYRAGGGAECVEVTRGKIDCPRCLCIIRFSKTIPSRMLKR